MIRNLVAGNPSVDFDSYDDIAGIWIIDGEGEEIMI